MLDRGLSRIFDVRPREDVWTQQQDTLIPVCLLWQLRSGLVPFGYNRLLWAVSPFISDESDHPGPIGREEEDVTLPGMRQMWYEVIRTTSLHT